MNPEDIERGRQLIESGKHAPKADTNDLATVLDNVEAWYKRFIVVCDELDLALMALWTVHTHLAEECYTTPRLLLDSITYSSGKTTVCEHMHRLACNAVHFATISSTPLLVRILENGVRTLLIDEVDRSLAPDHPGVGDLLSVLNSGYKVGATRPVLVQTKGNNWEVTEMPTHAPVLLAGNSPRLPADTRSRCLRILLMPDLNGAAEDSDWEYIEDAAKELHYRITIAVDSVRETVRSGEVDLPPKCTGRAREKWRPLKRVAVAAGGRWPAIVDELIMRGLAEDDADREDGLRSEPPALTLMRDLHDIWTPGVTFIPTRELVTTLMQHNSLAWGYFSPRGKPLTETGFGRMVTQATKARSTRVESGGPRGYLRADLEATWKRLGIRGDQGE